MTYSIPLCFCHPVYHNLYIRKRQLYSVRRSDFIIWIVNRALVHMLSNTILRELLTTKLGTCIPSSLKLTTTNKGTTRHTYCTRSRRWYIICLLCVWHLYCLHHVNVKPRQRMVMLVCLLILILVKSIELVLNLHK